MSHTPAMLRLLVQAAQADFEYWQSIADASSTSEPNGTIAFYVRFFEKISTGLNAVAQYHTPEEYVARFLERNHLFALTESEFERVALDLAEEMVLTGNSPVQQLDTDRVAGIILTTLRRWYYLLDRLDEQFFRKHKELIFDIIVYDVTTAFLPGHLDMVLLKAYESQFSLSGDRYSYLVSVTHKLGLPADFAMYLLFRCSFPSGWDANPDPAAYDAARPRFREIAETIRKSRTPAYQDEKALQQQVAQIRKQYTSELEAYRSYKPGYDAVHSYLISTDLLAYASDPLPVARELVKRLQALPEFPSNAFDEESIGMYFTEKLKRWLRMYDPAGKAFELPVIAHDLLRIFTAQKIDEHLVHAANRKRTVDEAILAIISARALKFSDKFAAYCLFLRLVPQWKDPLDVRGAESLASTVQGAVETTAIAFRTLSVLPKNSYASLMKGFTSFYTIKKLIEVYFQELQETTSLNERVDELYSRLVRRKPSDGAEPEIAEKLKEIEKVALKQPKLLTEEQSDSALYAFLAHGMSVSGTNDLADYLAVDSTREQYQQLLFTRFDAYTFNRIMATNAGGLANLFGTKGFIVLIEALLVGTGLEHLLNHTIEGSIGVFWNAFIGPAPEALAKLYTAFDAPFNFTPDAFGIGWAAMDWGKTALSLIIPIALMFLITGYNYVFFKLRRSENRKKSFRHLAATTKRWLTGHSIQVTLGRRKAASIFFELFKATIMIYMVYSIIRALYLAGFEPTQLALFFFLLSTICLSTYMGNKLKDEVTLGQSEAISDTIRDVIFIPIIEMGRFLSGQVKSINFIPWLVKTGVEPLYRAVISVLRSFISFQREKKDEII
ncbi:MAG: hypothetical protein N2691_04450 [Patescibacteria group bacterium]|nr:hypothetical protein [Patescibacteria group bacterium]